MLIDVTNPITEWIFPRRCLLCGVDIANAHICDSCLSLCNKAPITAMSNGNEKRAVFFYELSIKRLMIKAKYYHGMNHAHVLMSLIENQLTASGRIYEIAATAPMIITYVPTHWLNRVSRGIDLPQLFAQLLARKLNIPWMQCLVRRNLLGRQTLRESKTARRLGIGGSFGIKSLERRFERILLVDDIVTTGATFDESRKLLKRISDEVKCLAIARTP